MTYLLPSLNALRAFEAAARHLSFKRAAHELHVTAGAVSQQVRGLEERLGVRLFDRRTRQMALTPAGKAYLDPLRDAFGGIAAATAALMPEGIASVLRVGVQADVDVALVLGPVRQFRASQPRVGARVMQPAGSDALVEGKIDALVCGTARRLPGYRCEMVAAGWLVVPAGTAACAEIEDLRSCLAAAPAQGPRADAARRTARGSGPPPATVDRAPRTL